MSGDIVTVRGDCHGLAMPAHPDALRALGSAFLTAAFHANGVLGADNRITKITHCVDVQGGSTGRKLLLDVEYAKPDATLHGELFVKFSRDFDDPLRDRGKSQMDAEVRFAQLSCTPDFPIAVPRCYFADQHSESQTALLITQRIAYGRGGIEVQHQKCRDSELGNASAHYRALLRSLGRLAGTQQAGRLPGSIAADFPFAFEALGVAARAPYSAEQVTRRVERLGEFMHEAPALLPEALRGSAFLARLAMEAPRVATHGEAIRQVLARTPAHIALCHWNANIDNAWFWRGAGGELECGLMDWGCVSQMNLAMALWGALCGAETQLWEFEFDALLAQFIAEVHRAGGGVLDATRLRRELLLYAALMGINWLFDVPALLRARVPAWRELSGRLDPRIRDDEAARTPLQMLTVLLYLWQQHDIGRELDKLLKEAAT